jgi:hypothetical protein
MIKKDVLDVLVNLKIGAKEQFGLDSEQVMALTIAHQLAHCYYHVGEEKLKKGQKPIKAQDIKSGPVAPEGVVIEVAPGEFAENLGNARVLTNEEFMKKGGKGAMLEEPWMRKLRLERENG